MSNRNRGVIEAVVIATLAAGGVVRAGNGGRDLVPDELSLVRPIMLDNTPVMPSGNPMPQTAPTAAEPAAVAPEQTPAPATKPLMGALAKTPLNDFLTKTGITIGGYAEAGFTHSFSSPPGNVITGNVFNTRHDRVVLDQLNLAIDRSPDVAGAAKNHTIDIGGHIELIYGTDTRYFHSNGLLDRETEEYQFDVNQAYFTVALPLGNGLLITGGKFDTLLGYEVINPTQNAFYSHSYLFGYAIPFTQTGLLAKYAFNDQWTAQAGFTRGWGQSLKDNNGAIDFLGQVAYAPDKVTTFTVNVSEGPEAIHDNGDYWTVIDFQAQKKFGEKQQYVAAINADYGDAPHGTTAGRSAQWFGAALYGQYVMNDYVTLNARGEWYDDNNGATLGTGRNMQVYEATLGATVTPLPNHELLKYLEFRPEIRFDYANHRYYDAATDYYQVQFAIDAIYQF